MVASLISPETSFVCGLLELLHDNPERANEVAKLVPDDCFEDERNRVAVQLVRDQLQEHERPTPADMPRHPRWGECRDVVIECLGISASSPFGHAVQVDRFAALVRDAAARRRVANAVSDLRSINVATAAAVEIAAAADAVRTASESVEAIVRPMTLETAVKEYLANESTPRIPTGFSPLDSLTDGGLPVGGLTVFAAQPSVGKSALALQACLGALDRDESLTAVWCLGEMTAEALARRAVCVVSALRHAHAVTMSAADRRTEEARGAAGWIGAEFGPRLILTPPPLTMQRIEDSVVSSGARLLVVDYVQLVELEAEDRRAEVDGVVKRLRRLSLEHGVAVVAISNVSKAVGGDTRIGAIGKETSELDFAADLLLLGIPEETSDFGKVIRWACKKNRHGECRDLLCRFEGPIQTFRDAMAQEHGEFAAYSGSSRDPSNW